LTKDAQKADPEISQIRSYCSDGWPVVMPESPLLKQYWVNRDHFTIAEDLLLFDDRLVIPRDLRLDILNRLHEGHLGITKTRAFATTCVWWPNISSHIEETVNKCNTCAIHRPERKEPLLPSSFPERPWSRLGMDLFELKGKTFLVVVDYYSRWVELRHLKKLTSLHTINHIKSMFGVHGIPDVVVTDNGPQFSCAEFNQFASDWGFVHTTSSPRYAQSNGEAERCVQTVKKLLKKAKDPHAALLLYRATPLQNGFSPSQLLMGRTLKTKLPDLPSSLAPKTPNHPQIQKTEMQQKEKQRQNFDRRHATKAARALAPGETVFVKDMSKPGEVLAKHHNPRSYVVRTERGTIRRNRIHLVPLPGEPSPPLRRAPHPGTTSSLATTMEQPPPSSTPARPTTPAPPGSWQQATPAPPGSPPPSAAAAPPGDGTTHTPGATATPTPLRTKSGRVIKQPVRIDL
jgi:transposase InsO family protein